MSHLQNSATFIEVSKIRCSVPAFFERGSIAERECKGTKKSDLCKCSLEKINTHMFFYMHIRHSSLRNPSEIAPCNRLVLGDYCVIIG